MDGDVGDEETGRDVAGVSFESGRMLGGARPRRAVPTVLVLAREVVDATLRATERTDDAEDANAASRCVGVIDRLPTAPFKRVARNDITEVLSLSTSNLDLRG
jgi:hypothetical protein